MGQICNEAVVTYSRTVLLSRHLPGGSEENHWKTGIFDIQAEIRIVPPANMLAAQELMSYDF